MTERELPKLKRLTPQQERFCESYVLEGNGKDAAIRAGYAPKFAAQQAYKLLRQPHITRRIEKMRDELRNKFELTAENVVKKYQQIAMTDAVSLLIRDADTGLMRFRTPEELSLNQRALVSEVVLSNVDTKALDERGEPIVHQQYSYKTHNNKDALDSLARTLGMFRDRVDHEHTHKVKALFEFVARHPEQGETVARLDARHGRRRALTIEGTVERGLTRTSATAK